MVRAKCHRTFSECLSILTSTGEEEGQTDKVGHRPKRAEQADGQGQLPHHKHTGDLKQSARCYTVFLSLDACGTYHTVRIKLGSRACTAFISPFGPFQYIEMPFGLANAGSLYNRMLDMAMKEVDRDFWTSYLDDILTYSYKNMLFSQ